MCDLGEGQEINPCPGRGSFTQEEQISWFMLLVLPKHGQLQ